VFNKRKNEEREKIVTMDEPAPVQSTTESEITDTEPPMVEQEDTYSSSNNGSVKPANGNLKPSIISEGFEFIGEIRSNGYLTIDGTVRGTLSLHSIQIGATGVLDGNVSCDTMNVKGAFSGQLDCRDLTIGSRAVVDGKVSFKSITIQRGGVVKGELKKKA
jgi:cytoskeletal protein CcmA (bactofilin family)